MPNDLNRISEIRARCDEGRPIRRIDVKFLLDRLAEAEAEDERLRHIQGLVDEWAELGGDEIGTLYGYRSESEQTAKGG